jgi:hypothetical protein
MKQLLEFQRKVNAIKKDGKNPHFKSTYATLTQILSEVKPILSEIGLVLLQPIKDGKVYTILYDESGKEVASSYIDLPTGLNPQQLGSCTTYYRRYCLTGLLSLEVEDDDANMTIKPSKPILTPDLFEAMIKAINEGKKVQVIASLDKYTIDAKYKQLIDVAIKNN